MDLLSTLKNTLTDQTVSNLSGFVGEDASKVSNALSLSLNTFLGGLLKYTGSDAETFKIINVLKEGGHTGDLLNNLETFSGNNDKTRLLVTIGNNIVSHFFVQKTAVVDKIAEISGIKKTSASSLFSISAPVVLGLLGKEMKTNRLGATGLRDLLVKNSDGLKKGLPPAISNLLHLKNDFVQENVVVAQENIQSRVVETPTPKVAYVNTSSSSPKVESRKIETNTSSNINWGSLLAWLLLIAGGLFSLYYYNNIKNKKTDTAHKEIKVTDSTDLKSSDFLPDSSDDKPNQIVEQTVAPVHQAEVVAPAKIEVVKPTEKVIEVAPKVTIASPKPVEKVIAPKPTIKANKTNESTKDVVEAIAVKSNIPSGWRGMGQKIFANNSAEISNSGAVNSLVRELANSDKKIKIAALAGGKRGLSEDRAYAIRDFLIQKGVDVDKIEITSAGGNDNNGIAYKIVN